ncbi:hypothetical protein PIB30_072454 [Stylosanthes scabra]|uniref:Dynamin stalk domain-containing protein n=1 Tax=Stylosanthes scabra TaxID=79078 RepID=A0ABU6YLN4_9FABA|nr:hypothetical protein [Stylosanthes scabra]
MKEHMIYIIDHAEEIEKLIKVKAQVSEVKSIMLENIDKILEGRAYRLKFPWIGLVNRSQADINKNVDMIAAGCREREFFNTTPEYKHLAKRMGLEHLANMLSKLLSAKFREFNLLLTRQLLNLKLN